MPPIDPLFRLLSHALDVAAMRHSVHAANVANASVEGYRPLEVVESAAGIEALSGGAQVTFAAEEVVRLDLEMSRMAQNSLRYQALLGAFERATSLLSAAIHEGRQG